MSMDATLVLGGARSGKSHHAERLVRARPAPWIYLATAEARDDEMRQRIARHQADRGPGWTTVEEPLDLPGALRRAAGPGAVILVDCLTLWLTNLMLADRPVGDATDDLLGVFAAGTGTVVLVSNEVGLGIVPDNPLARAFRDEAGRLHQRVAEFAQDVVFMVAGQPMIVKGPARR